MHFLRLKNLSQIYPIHTTCDSYEKCYTEANSVDTHFRDDFGQFKIWWKYTYWDRKYLYNTLNQCFGFRWWENHCSKCLEKRLYLCFRSMNFKFKLSETVCKKEKQYAEVNCRRISWSTLCKRQLNINEDQSVSCIFCLKPVNFNSSK